MTNQSSYPFDAERLYSERFYRRYVQNDRSYTPLVAVDGVSPAERFPRIQSGDNTVRTQALDKAEEYAAERNSSALMVWRDGFIERAAFFGEVTAQTAIASGSLAKPLAAIAVGRAIRTGHIDSLDQPVADFFPEWRDSAKSRILVRHLLDGRSGLLPQSATLLPEQHVLNRAFLHPVHERILIGDYPLVSNPGEQYGYVNAASDLIAPLIQSATGKPYERWVATEVLQKIGAPGGFLWINRPNGVVHSACCSRFPAETFLRLGVLIASDGIWGGEVLLDSEFVAAMKSPTPENAHAGMGLYIGHPYTEWRGPLNPEKAEGRVYHSEPYAADDLVLFDGSRNQVVYIIPSAGLVILRMGGRPPADRPWDNAYLPNVVIRGLLTIR